MSYTRFALHYLPPIGALSTFGAKWLGWDVLQGETTPHFDIAGLFDITQTPQKYGFHGTLKAPFRLPPGLTELDLLTCAQNIAAKIAPARCAGLQIASIGRILALVPTGDTSDIARVAAACVTDFDSFRAPASKCEIAKRRSAGLTPRQDAHLLKWGYPYVLDDFRFHLTLSSTLSPDSLPIWQTIAAQNLPDLKHPFDITDVALVGERPDGKFELIQRYPLTGEKTPTATNTSSFKNTLARSYSLSASGFSH